MWKPGPLPKGTWNWGGVVTKSLTADHSQGFYFAGFNGDHAILAHDNSRVEPEDVVMYDNSLELPKVPETVQQAAERGFKGK